MSIIVIGAVMLDEVIEVPSVPAAGQGVVATSRHRHIGGCAYNTCAAVMHAGGGATLFAPIGRGDVADYLTAELAKRNLAGLPVDTDLDCGSSTGTALDCGSCLCLVDANGERTMITTPGVERHFQPSWFDSLDDTLVESFSYGVMSGFEVVGDGGGAILTFFEQHPHIQPVYAPGPCIMALDSEKLARIKSMGAWWHLNVAEAMEFTHTDSLETAGAALAAEMGAPCIVTASELGAYVFAPSSFAGQLFTDGDAHLANGDACCLAVPTTPIRPVDTTGAGDTHLGVLLAKLEAGCSWADALAHANSAAGQVCLSTESALA